MNFLSINPRITKGGGGYPPSPCIFSTPFFPLRFLLKRFRLRLGYSFPHLLMQKSRENFALLGICVVVYTKKLMALEGGWFYNPSRSQLGVKLSNEINRSAVRPNRKWQIQDGGLQTESTYISAIS